MEAGAADHRTADLLEVPIGTPVLVTERTAFAADDTPIEFVRAWHRAGLVRFRSDLSGDNLVHHPWMREIDVSRIAT
jgi:DNA-binding GntR family transcriptional regulator